MAQDFGLIYDSQDPPRRRYVRQKTEAQKFREDRQRCYRVLSDYYYLLKKWEADNSPRTLEEEPHPRFLDCFHKTGVRFFLRCPGRTVGFPFFQQIVVIGQYTVTALSILPKLLCLGFLPDISPTGRGLTVIDLSLIHIYSF